MKNCLRVLSQPTPSSAGEAELAADQQEREGALELLADLCENMDNAAGTASPPRPASGCQGPASSASWLPSAAQPLSFGSGTSGSASSPASQPPASPLPSGSDSGPRWDSLSLPARFTCRQEH